MGHLEVYTHVTGVPRGDDGPPAAGEGGPAAAANGIVLQVPSLARPIYNGVFQDSCTQRPFCFFEYFVLPKALKVLLKRAKMPETTREFGF